MSTVYIRVALFFALIFFSNAAFGQISGQVSDAVTGSPISGAHIFVAETNIGSSTSRAGNFRIDWHSFPVRIRVSAIGYKTADITIFQYSEDIRIRLQPVVYLSDEVLIADDRVNIRNLRTRPIPVTSVIVSGNNYKMDGNSAELLRSEKGVYVQQTTPGQGSVYVRGRAGRDVLYLFNGLRVNPSFVRSGQNQYFGVFDPFSINRINVFRGPVSVYYGSDALSGGIDITPEIKMYTEQRQWSGSTLSQANFGGTGERSLHTSIARTNRNTSIYLSGTARAFHYYKMPSGGDDTRWFPYTNRIEAAEYNYLAYTISSRFRINDRNQLSLTSFTGTIPDAPRLDQMIMGYKNQVLPNATAPDLAYASNTSPLLLAAHSLRWHSSVGSRYVSSVSMRAGYHVLKDHRKEIRFEDRPDLNTGFTEFTRSEVTNYDNNTSRMGLISFDVLIIPEQATLLRVGGDFSVDKISSERFIVNPRGRVPVIHGLPRYPDGSRYTQTGLFAHITRNLSADLWLEAGLRYSLIHADVGLEGAGSQRGFDPIDTWFQNITGSFGITRSPISNLYLSANISSGFRAPNIADLSEVGPRRSRFYQIPNPNLKPENTINTDFSVRWISESVLMEITAYRVKYMDKIESVLTGMSYADRDGSVMLETMNRNEKSMVLFGVESSMEIQIVPAFKSGFIFNFSYGELTERDGLSTPVDRIPPPNGMVYTRYAANDRLSVGLQARYALGHTRLSEAEKQDYRVSNTGTPGFTVLQMVANWSPTVNSSFRVLADNLMDTSYREHASTLDGLGRNLSLRYSYSF
jgi:outer membrane receptor protein involved in Fe transport